MFERRPVVGAILVLTVLLTIWQMSFQPSSSVGNNFGTPGSPYLTAALTQTPSLTGSTLHHSQAPALLPSVPNGEDDDGWRVSETTGTTLSANQTSILLVNPVELLPKDDYTSLIDLKDFRFTINFSNCTDSSRRKRESAQSDSLKSDERRSPLVLVLVHSAPNNWNKRNTIRDTWGQSDPRAKLVFLLGAVNSSALQRRIERESRQYDDIVQGNFLDTYRNITYKHVMALKWFTYHCPEAKYILKSDDDVFINTPTLYDVLESTPQRRRFLFCKAIKQAAAKRSYRSKWFVSVREYPKKYYPDHCPGYSIIYTPDIAFPLYQEAQQQPYFWIDDVHLTGTLAQRINVTITPFGSMLLGKSQKDAIIANKLNATDQMFFFTTPDLPEDHIRKMWKAVVRSKTNR